MAQAATVAQVPSLAQELLYAEIVGGGKKKQNMRGLETLSQLVKLWAIFLEAKGERKSK